MKKPSGLTHPSAPESHETIAALAKRPWEGDGRQSGRDLEYWLKAEHQLSSVKSPRVAAKSGGLASKARAATSRTDLGLMADQAATGVRLTAHELSIALNKAYPSARKSKATVRL